MTNAFRVAFGRGRSYERDNLVGVDVVRYEHIDICNTKVYMKRACSTRNP